MLDRSWQSGGWIFCCRFENRFRHKTQNEHLFLKYGYNRLVFEHYYKRQQEGSHGTILTTRYQVPERQIIIITSHAILLLIGTLLAVGQCC